MLLFNLELSTNKREEPKAMNVGSEDECNVNFEAANDKMPKVLDDMEEEIERQLEEKAQKTNLTVANVKNMLKAVITNPGVMDMVNYSLKRSSERPSYEPKLTRAKKKELLAKNSLTVLEIPLEKSNSEYVALIGQDLPEDSSSDEEYNPQEDLSDEESKCSEVIVQEDVIIGTQQKTVTVNSPNADCYENIGQRTRSKLCLSKTPLEDIEQAFVPPDITTDMYNTECDNQDWANFLKDFMKPLDANLNETVDDENDPEYNVMIDEECEEGPDIEELRVDRAVKITKKELNDLMSEIFEFTNTITSSIEEDSLKVKPLSSAERENNQTPSPTPGMGKKNRSQMERKTEVSHSTVNYNFTQRQFVLLKQQLRQHVQLLIQSFLLSYGHPYLSEGYAEMIRVNLQGLQHLGLHENSMFKTANLQEGIKLVNHWKNYMTTEKGERVRRFMATEIENWRNRLPQSPKIPEELMQICVYSTAFIYPLLLPMSGFKVPHQKSNSPFLSSEINLIAMGLEEFTKHLEEDGSKVCTISNVAPLISELIMPARSPASIHSQIMKQRVGIRNPIMEYFQTKKAPAIYHYLIPFDPDKQPMLLEQPFHLLPFNWAEYIRQLQRRGY